MKALDLRRRLLSRAQLLHRGPARRKSGEHDAMGAVESDEGFCNSIGLLVKAQRLGLRIGEVPALRLERKQGTSRFRVLKWRISAGFLCLRNDLAAAPAETVFLKALA